MDPECQYSVRAVYAGDNRRAKLRLLANERVEIHPFIAKELPIRSVAFEIPRDATARGELALAWYQEPGGGGAGRCCQIAEVWLTKKTP